MRGNDKIIQALLERPAELDSALSSDENADKMSLADTLITLLRSSSVEAVEQAEAARKISRLRRGS